MLRVIGSFIVGLMATGLAQAHFPFILPNESGSSVKVVFSDSLAPDPAVKIDKLDATKLFTRQASKDVPIEWKKGESWLEAKAPDASRVVFGVTEYGVLQKGDAKPFRLVYYSKVNLVPDAPTVGSPLVVEIVHAKTGTKSKFQVLVAGKPAEGLEVTVMLPGDKSESVKTDKDGFTTAFEGTGRFGVVARRLEAKAGEYAGRKYEEVRSYATLVVDVKP